MTAHLIASEVAYDVYTNSDYLLICLLLDILTPPLQSPKHRNWKAIDVQKLFEYIAANINPDK
jgi:hypothetical protein